ncbi:hypothetical protein HK104_002642 [Borealophlyctis nickersoniae]|nr:hypothetical protein HK104_002642 [Borealophlyctis nickersoniae]
MSNNTPAQPIVEAIVIAAPGALGLTRIAPTAIGLLGGLVFGLGVCVSMERNKEGRPAGCPDDPTNPLHRLVVAHRNTCEYAPMIGLLIYYLDRRLACPIIVPDIVAYTAYPAMLGLLASRLALTAGLAWGRSIAEVNSARYLGAWGQYIFGIFLSGIAIYI